MMDYSNPNWLREALAARPSITIVDLSKQSGVSRNQITRIKQGASPRRGTFQRLRDALEQFAA